MRVVSRTGTVWSSRVANAGARKCVRSGNGRWTSGGKRRVRQRQPPRRPLADAERGCLIRQRCRDHHGAARAKRLGGTAGAAGATIIAGLMPRAALDGLAGIVNGNVPDAVLRAEFDGVAAGLLRRQDGAVLADGAERDQVGSEQTTHQQAERPATGIRPSRCCGGCSGHRSDHDRARSRLSRSRSAPSVPHHGTATDAIRPGGPKKRYWVPSRFRVAWRIQVSRSTRRSRPASPSPRPGASRMPPSDGERTAQGGILQRLAGITDPGQNRLGQPELAVSSQGTDDVGDPRGLRPPATSPCPGGL